MTRMEIYLWISILIMVCYLVYKRSGKISGSSMTGIGGDIPIIIAALVVCGGLLWLTSVHAPVFWAAWCSPSIWTMIGSVAIFLACAYLVWRHHTLAYLGMTLVVMYVGYNYSQYKDPNSESNETWVQIMEINYYSGKKVYIPRWSGYTPAKVYIDFDPSFETQGRKVDFLFPCVNKWVHWDGTGFTDLGKPKWCKGWVAIRRN